MIINRFLTSVMIVRAARNGFEVSQYSDQSLPDKCQLHMRRKLMLQGKSCVSQKHTLCKMFVPLGLGKCQQGKRNTNLSCRCLSVYQTYNQLSQDKQVHWLAQYQDQGECPDNHTGIHGCEVYTYRKGAYRTWLTTWLSRLILQRQPWHCSARVWVWASCVRACVCVWGGGDIKGGREIFIHEHRKVMIL